MNHPQPFVDIHCHILPGLDDGPSAWEQSLAMAEMAVADGFATIVATPHQLGNYSQNTAAIIRSHVAQFQFLLRQRGILLNVLPGADVRIDPDLPGKIKCDQVLTLADRRKHVLLELPHEVYISLDPLLAALRSAGLTGILSHPERNQGILNQPNVLFKLADQGCLFQVTAGSLLGMFGAKIQKFSEYLIEQGLVDFIATDAHETNSRIPLLSGAFDRVVELADCELAVNMFCRNPSCVAAGMTVPSRIGARPRKYKLLGNKRLFNTSRQFVNFG
jgi:protein-tyrosine phosphatase